MTKVDLVTVHEIKCERHNFNIIWWNLVKSLDNKWPIFLEIMLLILYWLIEHQIISAQRIWIRPCSEKVNLTMQLETSTAADTQKTGHMTSNAQKKKTMVRIDNSQLYAIICEWKQEKNTCINYWNTIMNTAIDCVFVVGNIQGQGVNEKYARNVLIEVNAVNSRKNLIFLRWILWKWWKWNFHCCSLQILQFLSAKNWRGI